MGVYSLRVYNLVQPDLDPEMHSPGLGVYSLGVYSLGVYNLGASNLGPTSLGPTRVGPTRLRFGDLGPTRSVASMCAIICE